MGDTPWGKCVIMTKNLIALLYVKDGFGDRKPPVGTIVMFAYREGESRCLVDEE